MTFSSYIQQKFFLVAICAITLLAYSPTEAFAEIEGELYRSAEHSFRIKFPFGWSIMDGDGPNIVKKAVSKNGASILIRVTNLPNEFPVNSISDLSANEQKELCDGLVEGYIEGFKKAYPDSTILKTNYSTLDNHKAVDITSRSFHSSVGSSATMIMRHFSTVHNKRSYSITIGAEQSIYSSLEDTMIASARTFRFEDGYDRSATVNDNRNDYVFGIEGINSKKYHTASCSFVKLMKPEYLIKFQGAEQAKKAGFIRCKVCNPK